MIKAPSTIEEITLRVSESTAKDAGRGIARMDPADMTRLGVNVGDMVEVAGKRRTVCKVLPAFKEQRGQEHVQIDGIIRENAKLGLNEPAVVRRASVQPAAEAVFAPLARFPPPAISSISAA